MKISELRDLQDVTTISTCLKLVPPALPMKDIQPDFFSSLAMRSGGVWVFGKSIEQKEAYGRGMYQFMFHAMPDWMYLLCEHAADYGVNEESASKFKAKHPWTLPDDAEKFCLYWDRFINGMTPDEILEIDSQIPDDEDFDDPRLKELEEM